MIWRRGAFEVEVEWDHGPDVWIIFYGHRTHIFGISYQAYPTLRSASEPNFLGVLDRMWEKVYRDSPTETPFRSMVDAATEIANDPINDPEVQEKLREMVVTKASDIEPQQDRRRHSLADEDAVFSRRITDKFTKLRSDEVLPGVTAEEYRRNEKWYDERYAVNVRPPGWHPDDDPPGPGGHVA